MRFLLELVPCCVSLNPAQRKAPGSPTTPPPPESEYDDDVGSLVTTPPPPPPPLRLRKWARTATWSPSLAVIAEDRAAMTTAGGGLVIAQRKVTESAGSVREGMGRRTSGSGGGGGRRVGAGRARATDRRRDRDEYEYGRSYLSATMIPAFSPTPFVF